MFFSRETTLPEKVEQLRTQLGMEPGTPMIRVVEKAEGELGLTGAAEGRNLVDRVDLCLSELGGAISSTAIPVQMATPMAMAQPIMATPVMEQPVVLQGMPVAPVPQMMSEMEAPPPPVTSTYERVSVSMSADDFVDEIFYNGMSIRHTVSSASTPVPTLKTFSFDAVPGGVLAIAANDNQPGTSASFYMRCTSTNRRSGWNMQVRPGHPTCKAFGTGGVSGGEARRDQHVGSMGRPAHLNPPSGWEKNDFYDAHWKAPTGQTHTMWSAHHGMSPGVWHDQHKYTFYRIRPAPAAEHTGGGEGGRTDGLIATKDIEGCWICCCFPLFWWALFKKESTGPDNLKHAGCLMSPLLCPFEEHRTRHPGTNGFYKNGEQGNIDQYSSSSCVCNGLSCSMKLC